MATHPTAFLRNRRGAASAEFALLVPLFAGLLLGIVDFSRALWEHNKAMKACQAGARAAVVNDMIAPGLASFSGILDVTPPIRAGLPIPVGEVTPNPVTCACTDITGPPATCGAVSCTGFGADAAAFNAIIRKMAALFPRLSVGGTVDVTYQHVGLGFSGNPNGPDIWPLTTVNLRGLSFEFSTPLIGALAPFEFPRCRVTLSGEDFVS